MNSDVMIQYSGPYTIQSSDATISPQTVESVCISIDRGELKDYEIPISQDVQHVK